ncbi:hypothetical protein MSAN_01609200 [Mycena sanguinolenta]|uniref:Uncharacterized protein n=1 Tax=Mycena sanguinolenta TaxID=230812 RepID=A0A8H7CV90_9AGAR|nr:hypothetical protein MSAN_01609200 [Mycena sanguinolenta]
MAGIAVVTVDGMNLKAIVSTVNHTFYMMRYPNRSNPAHAAWFSQAHYIFSQFQTVSNHKDYVLIESVVFTLEISALEGNPPPGFLFLCSPTDFETGPMSFRWPECPAYWSLDPSGHKPLSSEKASSLGFPPIILKTRIHGNFWDEAVYAGLRRFHQGKGYDPDSQDVARELSYPLFELSVLSPNGEYIEIFRPDICVNTEDHLTSDDEHFGDFTSEDDHLVPRQECSVPDISLGSLCSLGKLVESVKFGLIVALALMVVYEHARKYF